MKHIQISLNSNSINDAIQSLEAAKTNIREHLCKNIVNRLSVIGIRVARENTGKWNGYIRFETSVDKSDNGYMAMLVGSDAQKVISRWRRGGKLVEAEVSPILMAEFGSGWYAQVNWDGLDGEVGQGTFPDQRHAFDPHGWAWIDENGALHRSQGEAPTLPMFNSWKEMFDAVNSVVKGEVQFFFA